jgi:hypothetical protein
MQRTMDEQMRQLYGERVSPGAGLTKRRFSREHHIAQHLRVEVGKRPVTHRKGEDIGGAVDAAIAGVEPTHPGIIDDEYTQITVLTFEGREQPQQRLSERPSVDRDDLLLVPTTDGHSCFAYGASLLPIRPMGIRHDGGR